MKALWVARGAVTSFKTFLSESVDRQTMFDKRELRLWLQQKYVQYTLERKWGIDE